jgi:hypothetical protein
METCLTDPGNVALQCTTKEGVKKQKPFATEGYDFVCFPLDEFDEFLKGER